MSCEIVTGDITTIAADAIVNAANTDLAPGGGVCGAIFAAAGAEQLEQALAGLGPIATGEAVATPAFGLNATIIIHAAGPIYCNHTPAEAERLLADAYRNSIELAAEKGCSSIAFPLISSGIYGYPKDEALKVAQRSITQALADRDMRVMLVLYG
ncbi:macro domain-containing protein [Corynebacterium mendelii]|uniref:Macro domain-containing protein n=1 Tax=Corynebacterium mendelii TaxID=2765362 RepID=A0A939IWV6_9CORY|nr:macro domain-containing protein [Corynebacterium mendelii]MBN9643835.1 macro domain-containing protein [Corynebacterium mendelii]